MVQSGSKPAPPGRAAPPGKPVPAGKPAPPDKAVTQGKAVPPGKAAPAGRAVPVGEVAALKARTGALRQAASLPGADPEGLLQAAFTELDGAIDGLVAAGAQS